MLELPESFKVKVINRYNALGQKWLNHIDAMIAQYTKQFELQNIELAEKSNVNLVVFATSRQFGDIVMKFCSPSSSCEMHIMQQYSENYVPKCYYFNLDDRVMILERLSPGYSLNHLESLEERIKIFSDLSNHLFIPATGTENFLTFAEIFENRMQYLSENKSLFSDILWMFDIAQNIYKKIQHLNLPKYILHDDLHHKNILKAGETWKAIDPHGIIGERVFETCQFIRSELKISAVEKDNINKIVSLVSHYFGEDKTLILEALYVYRMVDKIIWLIKFANISFSITICKILLEMLKE